MTTAPPLHPAHLAAVRAAQAGDSPAARDVRFLTDYAAFAAAVGEPALAATLYARAIEATPGDSPPLRLRHALAVMDSGQSLGAIPTTRGSC